LTPALSLREEFRRIIMVTVRSEPSRCLAYGNCAASAPEVYDIEGSVVKILLPNPPKELEEGAREGAAMCPVNALLIVEDPES
jgi:ferredoxin